MNLAPVSASQIQKVRQLLFDIIEQSDLPKSLQPASTPKQHDEHDKDVNDSNNEPEDSKFESTDVSPLGAGTGAGAKELSKDSLHAYSKEWATDPCCARYLRARSMDVDKAAQSLFETIKWRLTFGADNLYAMEHKAEIAEGRMYVSKGRDRAGRPIIMNHKGSTSPPELGQALRMIAYTLERAVAEMGAPRQQVSEESSRTDDPMEKREETGASDLLESASSSQTGKEAETKSESVEKHDGRWVWIMDMANYSRANRSPMQLTKDTIHIFQSHYVERLHKAYILDAPWLFRALWSMVSPFIDPVTKAKLQFINGRELPETRMILEEAIAPDQLETDFGGPIKFDPEEYIATDGHWKH